ncbi:MAG: hypothetical protein CMQ49_06100 [Gammaproteobacteria bacterium]|nr:hypothetical protein [Gammaproteobacteria bacterium]
MVRNLLTKLRVGVCWFGVCALLGPGAAWALGLGEIELESALNERLDARIELLDSAGLQPTEIIVSLASGEDFERVGVERFFFLTDLSFEVAFDDAGNAVVIVTSSQAITEPYLNFLVEVLWSSGRILKEYTLLLDPPMFSEAPAPAVQAPRQQSVASQSAGRVAREPEPAPSRTGTRMTLTPAPPAPRLESSPLDNELMTTRDDTLWKISARTIPASDISVQQNMLAIQRLNRRAFINDNINQLKAGYVLRLPSAEEARAVRRTDALAEVAAQHDEWRTGRRRQREEPPMQVAQPENSDLSGQLDARAVSTPGPRAEESAEGELTILAGEGDSATGLAPDASEIAQLDAALEETDRLAREVDELTYQLDREKELAGSQLEIRDRQIEVKDQEIAELQAQLTQTREELQEASRSLSQNQSAAVQPEPWWQSTAAMGSAAGVLVLALVGGLIMARRRREDEDEYYAAGEAVDARHEPEVAAVPEAAESQQSDGEDQGQAPDQVLAFETAKDEDNEPGLDAESFEVGEEVERVERVEHEDSGVDDQASSSGDVIAEADIYIAYGRYSQAVSLLLGVLDNDPDRNDVRLKVLEIFAETEDRQSFEPHMVEFVDRCDDQDALLTARELEGRLTGDQPQDDASTAGTVPYASTIDDADDLDEPAGLTEVASEESDEFELELDTPDTGAGDQVGRNLGLDFDLETEPEETSDLAEALEQSEVASGDEDFDFDEADDSANTKLDLARAYIDMGDEDGARDILNEVLQDGSDEQRQQAQALLDNL